jgi:hypothetical protein
MMMRSIVHKGIGSWAEAGARMPQDRSWSPSEVTPGLKLAKALTGTWEGYQWASMGVSATACRNRGMSGRHGKLVECTSRSEHGAYSGPSIDPLRLL